MMITDRIQSKLKDFSNSASMHGLSYLTGASTTVSKLFWLAVFCGSLGMFCFMTTLNVLQYFSYSTTIDTQEEPNGFVPPYITFCNHRHVSMSIIQDLINIVERQKVGDSEKLCLVDNGSSSPEVQYFYHVLEVLHVWMYDSNVSDRNVLSSRENIFTQLSEKTIDEITPSLDELVISCKSRDKFCNFDYFTSFVHSFFFKCYVYDPLEGRTPEDGVAQGINFGQTFVFLSGSEMISDGTAPIPGFDNFMRQTGGTDGVRLVIHARGTVPDPLNEGVDIPTGASVVLGISSQETHRLEQPYGNCSRLDVESIQMLKYMNNNTEILDDWNKPVKYKSSQCRSSCQQRHSWEHCGCLDINLLAPVWPWNNNKFCRYMDFSKHNVNDIEQCCQIGLNDTACGNIMEDVIKDIDCIQEITGNISKWTDDCDCRPPCEETQYSFSYSLSTWPAKGPMVNYAYEEVVRDILIPRLNKSNVSGNQQFVHYFSNESNAKEIMSNFAKVTVYCQTLSVSKTLQIRKYSLVDTFSNAGGLMGLWLGISVVSLFEILTLTISIFGVILEKIKIRSE